MNEVYACRDGCMHACMYVCKYVCMFLDVYKLHMYTYVVSYMQVCVYRYT